jgi:hypothetical protein
VRCHRTETVLDAERTIQIQCNRGHQGGEDSKTAPAAVRLEDVTAGAT